LRQLSPFRNLDHRHFDVFIGIIFDERFSVSRACRAPWQVVLENATHNEHVNGHVLCLRDRFWMLPCVEDVTMELQEVEYAEQHRRD
jgi:hypothetical protein